MNKQYFHWLWHKQKPGIIFLALMYLILIFTPFFGHRENIASISIIRESYQVAAYLSLFSAVLLPLLLFAYVHRKCSVDLYFSLPVSRLDQLTAGILYSWILSAGLFAAGTLMVTLLEGSNTVTFGQWAVMQPWALGGYLVVILFTLWTYLTANNLFDGVVMVAAYAFLPAAVEILISCYANMLLPAGSSQAYISISEYFSPVVMTMLNLINLMPGKENVINLIEIHQEFIPGYIIALVLFAVFSIFGLKKQFIQRKSERAEQISDDFAAYPFIIHIYALIVLLVLGLYSVNQKHLDTDTMIGYVLLFAIYVIALFVYRRTVKINWKRVALFIGAMILTYGICWIGWKTKGFAQADHYSLEQKDNLIYSYSAVVNSDNLGQCADRDETDGDAAEWINVHFDITIPTDQISSNKTVELMEQYRKSLINAFYSPTESDKTIASGSLFIYNQDLNDPDKAYNNFTYALYDDVLLSEDELLAINQVAPVWVDIYQAKYNTTYAASADVNNEMRIDEYLKYRSGQN